MQQKIDEDNFKEGGPDTDLLHDIVDNPYYRNRNKTII